MPRSPHAHRPRLTLAVAALATLTAVVPHGTGFAAGISYKLARAFPAGTSAFGQSLAVNAHHVVVGVPSEAFASRGAVYVFDRATGALRFRLTSPTPERHFFGWSVALRNDLVVVGEQLGGAVVNYQHSGAVHLYDATTGALIRTLPSVDPTKHGGLGTAVDTDGGFIVATAPYQPWGSAEPRVALVYDAAGTIVRTLVDPDPTGNGYFGMSARIAGGEVLIGKSAYDAAGGAVYRFDLATGALVGALRHPDPNAVGFGESVAAFGDVIVVGAADAAVVFDRATGDIRRTLPNPFPDGTLFAQSVAVGAPGVLVGQPGLGRRPVAQIGAVLLFDPDSGALRAMLAEPPEDFAFVWDRAFGRRVLIDGERLFVSGGGTDAFEIREYRPACGDGVVDACERCDDGNRIGGDGCDDACLLESCGDGVTTAGEQCDDGNAVDGDGCDTTCTFSGCGNCVVAGPEACDDGNTVTGDACDANCTFAACQNGAVGPLETCDDGNAIPGDGCSQFCKAEICGDAVVDAGESCDDGNTVADDGCDATCRLETTKLDWWTSAYGVFAGDFNPFYGGQHVAITDRHVLVLTHDEQTWAVAYDRDTGETVHTFPGESAGPLEGAPGGILLGDGDDRESKVHLYDATSFALRHTFRDPTPATAGNFGRYVGLIGDTVLIQDGDDHGIHLFDAVTGDFARTLLEPADPNAPTPRDPIAFGAVMIPFRGGALLSGSHAAHHVDLATGAVVRTFRGPDDTPVLGRRIAALGADVLVPAPSGEVLVLDGATGAVRHTFLPPRSAGIQNGWLVTVAGADVLIASTTLGVVHVYDAATFAFRHTIRDPEHREHSCFGAPLAVTDLGLAVSDACDGEDHTGVVYLFDRERGAHIATIGNPHGDYRDFFSTRGAFGRTLLTWYQSSDEGVVNAWRPTTDGVLTPGEECDDGNLVNGDGCDVNGTVTRCGNGFRTDGEACDDGNRTAGDGCERDCTPTFRCDGTVGFEDVRLTLRNLGGAAGNEGIDLVGRLTGVPPGLAAAAHGLQVLIEDAEGRALVDLTSRTTPIVPGARGDACGTRDGWRVDRRRETYANASGALAPACVPGSAAGLTRVAVTRGGSDRTIRLHVRNIVAPAFVRPLRAVVAFGAESAGVAARCGSRAFAELECRPNRRGTTLTCRTARSESAAKLALP